MRRSTGVLLQMLAGSAVLLVLLGVLELACTLYLGTVEVRALPGGPDVDSVLRTMRFIQSNPAPLLQDLDLLWRNEPGARRTQPIYPRALGRSDTWTVAINSEGFRGPERHRDDAGETFRVLCVGDSVTFGYHVDQGAEFPRRLEDLLRRRHPGRSIEVVNAGVPGWSWAQGLRFLERDGLALRPDLVVAAHGTNDQYWNATATDSEHMWLLTNPVLRSLQSATGLLQGTAVFRVLARAVPPPAGTPLSPGCAEQRRTGSGCHRVSLEEIEGAARAMHNLTSTAGVDLIVMNLDFLETPSAGAIRRAVERDGIPFIDQVARFTELSLAEQLTRSWDLGLALPRVPSVRLRPPGRRRARRTQRVLLRVLVAHPAAEVTVRSSVNMGEETIDQRMYDDGTHGDEIGGDAVFSITLHVPDTARAVRYRFYVDGATEFEPPPGYPPAWASRVLRIADDSVAQVDVLGQRFLMAENVHPDAFGHQVIATGLADEIDRLGWLRDGDDPDREGGRATPTPRRRATRARSAAPEHARDRPPAPPAPSRGRAPSASR